MFYSGFIQLFFIHNNKEDTCYDNTMGIGPYPHHKTDQGQKNFNYYKATSQTYYSQHGPRIICLAC